MLIISIIMIILKKTKIRIAYCLLGITSISITGYDANERVRSSVGSSEPHRTHLDPHPASLPFTPLAQSPFPEARPGYSSTPEPTVASTAKTPAALRGEPAALSSVRFLTVAVKVDSGATAVALNRGTRVHFVREQDGKFLVRRNGTDFLIEKTQVTDNIASLGKLARNSS